MATFACLPKLAPDQRLERIKASDFLSPEWEYDGSRFVKETMRSTRGPRATTATSSRTSLDFDLGFFLGLYVAEGHTSRAEVRLSLHEDEIWLVDAACG